MNEWIYAQLTHCAKECGGPKALLENIYKEGYLAGQKDAFLAIIVVSIGTVTVGGIIFATKKYIDNRGQKAKKKIEQEAITLNELINHKSINHENTSDKKEEEKSYDY